MPWSSQSLGLPAALLARTSSHARQRLSWRRTPFQTQQCEDRTVPSAVAPISDWSALRDETPFVIAGTALRELVIVDSRVPDHDGMIQDLLANQSPLRRFDVITLRPDVDGIAQITAALQRGSGYAAVHIISHANSQGVQLGSAWLNVATLAQQREQVAAWSQSLKSGADILLYGCDLAASQEGRKLLQQLHDLTGADVAASNDRTGARALGGNWKLEYTAGHIEADLALSANFARTYTGSLATFIVTSTANSGAGTLRQAIANANATAGADTITFNITGTGVHTINLTSKLPTITERVLIDGYTQAGSSLNTLAFGTNAVLTVELNGAGAGSVDGLTLGAGSTGSVIKGLIINRFGNNGIQVSSDGNTIVGCFIGTDSTGLINRGNQVDGITISANNNTIGGSAVSDRNLLSGNQDEGLDLDPGTSGNIVLGNLVGTNAAGTAGIPNGSSGTSGGILIDGANNRIGGTGPNDGNVIAFNNGPGLLTGGSGVGNTFLGNAIFSNSGLGIDLEVDGVSLNDAGDGDGGFNNLQNFPVLSLAQVISSNQLSVTGSLNSLANSFFRVEFFASTAGDGSNHGEGQRYLGFIHISTNGLGNVNFSTTLTAPILAGEIVSATATKSVIGFGSFTDTSEFSLNIVASNTAPTLDASKSPVLGGIVEDAGVPLGAVGTLVSSLIDFALPAGQVDNITDPDTGAQLGIAITAANSVIGVWWYTIDGGTSWSALGAVTGASARLLAADANTRIYFQPGANFNGTMPAAITFRAWDRTNGSNGALMDTTSNGGLSPFSTTQDTAALTVTGVNDLPVVVDQALQFDGVNDVVVANPSLSLAMSTAVTIEAWIQRQGLPIGNQVILSKEGEYQIGISATGSVIWAFANSSPGWTWFDTGYIVPANVWSHVAVTYNSSVANTYVNGVLVHTSAANGAIGDAAPLLNELWIGGRQSAATQRFQGLIDDVRVWNTARTSGQVAANYNLTLTGAEAGLMGYWRFAESSGLAALDASSNANHGLLGGGVAANVPTRLLAFTLAEDGTLTVGGPGVLTMATDADGDAIQALFVAGPSNATSFTLNVDGSFNYVPLGDFNGVDSFTFRATDGKGVSTAGRVSLTVAPVNDAPVNAVPPGQYTAFNTPLVFSSGNGNLISISDVDAGVATMEVTLVVGQGALTLSSIAGLTFVSGANGTASMTISGSLADINAALAGMSFAPPVNYRGVTQFQITTNDLGNSGVGGPLFDADSLKIYVGAMVVTNANDLVNGSVASIQALAANDGGDGISLREAILATNATAGPDYITFDIAGAGVHVIQPSVVLPSVTDLVIIDGTTQPGYVGSPLIQLDGTLAGIGASGLTLAGGSSIVRGLAICGFNLAGIRLTAAGGNTIQGNYLGVDADGVTARGNGLAGLAIDASSTGNQIGGTAPAQVNVISGNDRGILVDASSGNLIQGNFIGTDRTGTIAVGNANSGIEIRDGGGNIIGGSVAGARNLIAGNVTGVQITGSMATFNAIVGNYIGTDASGITAMANSVGVYLDAGASDNSIGGLAAGTGNIISGNTTDGVRILDAGTVRNLIYRNWIGLDATGVAALGNGAHGINIQNASDNVIGAAAAGNLISGNGQSGVSIYDVGATGNVVRGNWIGLDASGALAIGNAAFGVYIIQAGGNIIGGAGAGQGNVFAGNSVGVEIFDTLVANSVAGNSFGFDATGALSLASGAAGVQMDSAANQVVTGNAIVASANGIVIWGSASTGNNIRGNFVGTDFAGTALLGNGNGILIGNDARDNIIGGFAPGEGNLIAGNAGAGIAAVAGSGNRFFSNSFHDNGGLAIDLGLDGVTANDSVTNPARPNNGIDYAVFSSVSISGNTLTVAGSAGTPFANVQIYLAADDGNNNGPILIADGLNVPHGEGRIYLGTIIADAAGNFAQSMLVAGINVGDAISAIVIDAVGNSSEFSANRDCVAPGIIVSPLSLTTDESGATAQFTVVLASAPSAQVVITIANGDVSEGSLSTTTLTFDSTNWNTPQVVTITGVNDFVIDGSITYAVVLNSATSADAGYNGLDPADVSVTNTDDDVAGIVVTPVTGLTTTEAGGTAAFTVVLTSQPVGTVTINVSSSDPSEGTVSVSSLIFDASNWNIAQTVTITGANDLVMDGNVPYTIVLSPATSTDPNYNGLDPADVSVTNNDDDVAGIVVTPVTGLTTTEAGGTAAFTVVLTSQPVGTVTINVSSSDPSEGTVSVSSLIFDASNWNIAQTVTITGANDLVMDGNVPYTIVLSPATSTDPNYNGLDPADVGVTNTDDDVAGIVVTPVTGQTTTEAGGTAAFTVVLTSQPVGTVTINVSSSDPSEGTVSVSSLIFDASNWNIAQTVTVTGVNDSIADGDITYGVATSPATSLDITYAGLDAADVSIVNLNDDTAGIRVIAVGGLIVDGDNPATVQVSLTSQPLGPVTISIASANAALIGTSPSILVFTDTDWSLARVVTLTAGGLDRTAGDILVSIAFAGSSIDTSYDGQAANAIAISRVIAGPPTTPSTVLPPRLPPLIPIEVPPRVIDLPDDQQSNPGEPVTGGPTTGVRRLPDGGGSDAEADGSGLAKGPTAKKLVERPKLDDKTALVHAPEMLTPYKPLIVPSHATRLGPMLQLPDKVGDEMTEEKAGRASSARMALGTVVIASAGCVLWSLRGAAWLLSAAASSAPAWTVLDPMALLMARQRRRGKNNEGESLAELANTTNRF